MLKLSRQSMEETSEELPNFSLGIDLLASAAIQRVRARTTKNEAEQTLFQNLSQHELHHILVERHPGGGYSKKFYTGRLRPEVQPLTLLYTIFSEKGTPFVYLLLEKGTPFIYLNMNKSLKQEVFLSFFSRSA